MTKGEEGWQFESGMTMVKFSIADGENRHLLIYLLLQDNFF